MEGFGEEFKLGFQSDLGRLLNIGYILNKTNTDVYKYT